MLPEVGEYMAFRSIDENKKCRKKKATRTRCDICTESDVGNNTEGCIFICSRCCTQAEEVNASGIEKMPVLRGYQPRHSECVQYVI